MKRYRFSSCSNIVVWAGFEKMFVCFLGPALILQLKSAEDMERIESKINFWLRDPDLVVAVTSPDTLKPAAAILDKNICISHELIDRELAAHMKALTKANFFVALAPPKTSTVEDRRTYLDLV
jgi:hypothetical protein